MSKGGARPGAGRPLGSSARHTRALVDALTDTGADDLVIGLARVIDDAALPLTLRCEAARHLSGAGMARIISSIDSMFR